MDYSKSKFISTFTFKFHKCKSTGPFLNNKLDIEIINNEKGTSMLRNGCGNFKREKWYKNRSREDSKEYRRCNRIERVWKKGKNISYTNHLKIIHKTPEQHIKKERNEGTTKNSHSGHCTQNVGSADVKVQNIQHGK